MVMDILRSQYRGVCRMVDGEGRTFLVRWYPCKPGAKAFPYLHAFGSHVWEGPPWFDFANVGELNVQGDWRPKKYPAPPGQHFHGPLEWFQHGIPPEMLGVGEADRECGFVSIEMLGGREAGQTACWGCDPCIPILCMHGGREYGQTASWHQAEAGIWVQITEQFENSYSWVQVAPSDVEYGSWPTEADVLYEVVSGGLSGSGNLFERNSFPNVRVGAVVSIVQGAGNTFLFDYEQDSFSARIVENLGGGSYLAIEEYPSGSIFDNSRTITIVEGSGNSSVSLGTSVVVYVQRTGDTWSFYFSERITGGDSLGDCSGCSVYLVDVDITTYTSVYTGVYYYVLNSSTGDVITYVYLCYPSLGFCGWYDLCACAWVPWYYYGGICYQYLSPPVGAVGPYTYYPYCAVDHSDTYPYWCVSGTCVQSATEPLGATGGPYYSPGLCYASCAVTDCCPDDLLPEHPTAVVVGGGFLAGSYRMSRIDATTWHYDADLWGTCAAGPPALPRLVLTCPDAMSGWSLTVYGNLTVYHPVSVSCADPFRLIFTGVDLTGCGGYVATVYIVG